jgi:hypothetical protein
MIRFKSPRFITGTCLGPLLLALLVPGQIGAVEIPMEHHCWGRFEPGAWQQSRTVTETLDEQGNVVSLATTEQKTTLVAVEKDEVTLRIESTVEVGGKKFAAPVQVVSQGAHGEVVGRNIETEDLGSEPARVDGQPIVCRVKRFVIADHEDQKTVKVYYSPTVAPYVIRRETVVTGRRARRAARRTAVEVVALEMPHKVFAEIVPTTHTKTVQENEKGSTVAFAVHAHDVPGEIVTCSTKEVDADGQLVRRSTTEIVDFGYAKETIVNGVRVRPRHRRRLR